MPAILAVLLAWFAALAVATAADELPKVARDQLDNSGPALAKAFGDFRKRLLEENAKLVATLQKALEKATKAGNFDEAVAVKKALEQAKSGELMRAFIAPALADPFGDGTLGADPDGPAVVTLSTGDPVGNLAANQPAYSNRDYLFSAVPAALQGFSYAKRPFKEPAACTLKVVGGGVLYVVVGTPPDGLDLPALGFVATDMSVKCTTGHLPIVKKQVRAGETIVLPASAVTNSFPIWKAK
ncbi:MAG: hypothetical protein H0X38_02315 [Planctomycetes bacterium]|nr:hypothetical protein [Planctomycetota bacterium]